MALWMAGRGWCWCCYCGDASVVFGRRRWRVLLGLFLCFPSVCCLPFGSFLLCRSGSRFSEVGLLLWASLEEGGLLLVGEEAGRRRLAPLEAVAAKESPKNRDCWWRRTVTMNSRFFFSEE
ncbi:hypothetical protein Peur_037094 [Populus x canadensis]